MTKRTTKRDLLKLLAQWRARTGPRTNIYDYKYGVISRTVYPVWEVSEELVRATDRALSDHEHPRAAKDKEDEDTKWAREDMDR